MKKLICLFWLTCLAAVAQSNNTINVIYNLQDFTSSWQGLQKCGLTPLSPIGTNGNVINFPVERQLLTTTTGQVSFSNVLTGYSYRFTLYSDPYAQKIIGSLTNYFPTNLTGTVEAAGYLGYVGVTPFGAFSLLPSTNITFLTNGGFVYISSTEEGGGGAFSFLPSTNITFVTNGGFIYISSMGGGGGDLVTNIINAGTVNATNVNATNVNAAAVTSIAATAGNSFLMGNASIIQPLGFITINGLTAEPSAVIEANSQYFPGQTVIKGWCSSNGCIAYFESPTNNPTNTIGFTPILTVGLPQSYNGYGMGSCVHSISDGLYHEFCETYLGAGGPTNIAHYVSSTGSNGFVLVSNVVSVLGGSPSWMNLNIANVGAIEDGTNHALLVDGYGTATPSGCNWEVGLFSGPDWYHLTPYAGNPVLSSTNSQYSSCRPFKVGSLYYTFNNPSLGWQYSKPSELTLLSSPDLIHWTRCNRGFSVITRQTAWDNPANDSQSDGSEVADCFCIPDGNQTFFYYTGVTNQSGGSSSFRLEASAVALPVATWINTLFPTINVLNGPTRIGMSDRGVALDVTTNGTVFSSGFPWTIFSSLSTLALNALTGYFYNPTGTTKPTINILDAGGGALNMTTAGGSTNITFTMTQPGVNVMFTTLFPWGDWYQRDSSGQWNAYFNYTTHHMAMGRNAAIGNPATDLDFTGNVQVESNLTVLGSLTLQGGFTTTNLFTGSNGLFRGTLTVTDGTGLTASSQLSSGGYLLQYNGTNLMNIVPTGSALWGNFSLPSGNFSVGSTPGNLYFSPSGGLTYENLSTNIIYSTPSGTTISGTVSFHNIAADQITLGGVPNTTWPSGGSGGNYVATLNGMETNNFRTNSTGSGNAETNLTLINPSLGGTTTASEIIASNLDYSLATSGLGINMNNGYAISTQSVNFTFTAPINVNMAAFSSSVFYVTNSSGAAIQATAASGWKTNGTFTVTNVSSFTVNIIPGWLTNVISYNLY